MWPFSVSARGYGWASVDGKLTSSHRYMCILRHGAPPFVGAQAAHECGNSGCFNPNHLSWKTAKANSADRIFHGTQKRKLTHEQAIAVSHDNRTSHEIAAELGVDISTVSCIRSGKTWNLITGAAALAVNWKGGEHNNGAKLTEVHVRAIMQDHRPAAQVGRDYGVSDTAILSIRSGLTWSHVTGVERKPRPGKDRCTRKAA